MASNKEATPTTVRTVGMIFEDGVCESVIVQTMKTFKPHPKPLNLGEGLATMLSNYFYTNLNTQ